MSAAFIHSFRSKKQALLILKELAKRYGGKKCFEVRHHQTSTWWRTKSGYYELFFLYDVWRDKTAKLSEIPPYPQPPEMCGFVKGFLVGSKK